MSLMNLNPDEQARLEYRKFVTEQIIRESYEWTVEKVMNKLNVDRHGAEALMHVVGIEMREGKTRL